MKASLVVGRNVYPIYPKGGIRSPLTATATIHSLLALRAKAISLTNGYSPIRCVSATFKEVRCLESLIKAVVSTWYEFELLFNCDVERNKGRLELRADDQKYL